jgi:hypothetical protein
MHHNDDRGTTAARVLAYPERWLRPADRLDLAIRRWVTPVHPEVTQTIAAALGSSRSTSRRDLSMRNGPFVEVQSAIGRYLRAEYDLAQPIPTRLVDLVGRLEQRDRQSERVAA